MAVGFQMNTMLVNRMLALEQAHIVEHKVCDSKMSLPRFPGFAQGLCDWKLATLIAVTAAVKPH